MTIFEDMLDSRESSPESSQGAEAPNNASSTSDESSGTIDPPAQETADAANQRVQQRTERLQQQADTRIEIRQSFTDLYNESVQIVQETQQTMNSEKVG